MVYQQPNWARALNVVENVAFPLVLLGQSWSTALPVAQQVLRSVGMHEWAEHAPSELSSGQQQKVSLARALVTNPDTIVADEPTGNLDFESGQELMSLLQSQQRAGKTIIMVTHDLEYLSFADCAIELFDGAVIHQYCDQPGKNIMQQVKKNHATVKRSLETDLV